MKPAAAGEQKQQDRTKTTERLLTSHVEGEAAAVRLVEEVQGSPGVLQVFSLLGAPLGALLLDLLHGGHLVLLLVCNHNSAETSAPGSSSVLDTASHCIFTVSAYGSSSVPDTASHCIFTVSALGSSSVLDTATHCIFIDLVPKGAQMGGPIFDCQ